MHGLVVAPLVSEIYTLRPTYVFDPELILQNAPQAGDIVQLEADLGDGVWRTLIQDGKKQYREQQVSYKESGEKTVKFRATWRDGHI